MTVLEKKAAIGIEWRRYGRYAAAGIVAAAVGVASVAGVDRIVDSSQARAAQQAMAVRGAAVASHLDVLSRSGLAQQLAITEAARLRSRVESGLAQQAAIAQAGAARAAMLERGRAVPEHLDDLIASGNAQRAAIDAHKASS